MDCSEFIARFSEYYDGRREDKATGPMEAHLEVCASCRRYHRVLSQAGQLLRSLPRPTLPSDFRPRLQHRIYHVEDERALPPSVASGTTATTALAMAVLLSLAAWTPAMRSTPAPVASSPDLAQTLQQETTRRDPGPDPASLFRPVSVLERRPVRDGGLWAAKHSHSLLYEYSLLSRDRSREAAPVRQNGL